MKTVRSLLGGFAFFALQSTARATQVRQEGQWNSGTMLAKTMLYYGGKTYYFNTSGICTNP